MTDAFGNWLFFINRNFINMYTRARRYAYKPPSCKSRFIKRWEKHHRRVMKSLKNRPYAVGLATVTRLNFSAVNNPEDWSTK